MRGDVTRRILEALSETVLSVGDIVEAILSSGYGASSRKMLKKANSLRISRERARGVGIEKERIARRYQKMISRLKQDGLIVESDGPVGSGGPVLLKMSKLGLSRLRFIRKERGKNKILPGIKYPKEAQNIFTIVAFDIPEKYRARRDWLRGVLRGLGLVMIQRSVWLGKVKIPSKLIDDLKDLGLLDNVEIFEISKEGTLKNLT